MAEQKSYLVPNIVYSWKGNTTHFFGISSCFDMMFLQPAIAIYISLATISRKELNNVELLYSCFRKHKMQYYFFRLITNLVKTNFLLNASNVFKYFLKAMEKGGGKKNEC